MVVVGLGLGVWKIRDDQNDMFVETVGDLLKVSLTDLSYISFPCFMNVLVFISNSH